MNNRDRDAKSTPKKGNVSWQPAAHILSGIKALDGYRLRWINRDASNVEKKQSEGWVIAEAESHYVGNNASNPVKDGGNVTGGKVMRDVVLAAMPEELAKAREQYYRDKTMEQTVSLKKNLAKEIGTASNGVAAPVHGKIVIE